jgi:hypothetical protein
MTDRNARAVAMADIDREFNLPPTATKGMEKLLMGPSARGEQLGRILMGLLLPAVEKLQQASERNEQINRNLHLAFALAMYQRDNNRYPETLADMAPKYLDKIPDDLFAGKPLTYKREEKGYLLYSVGANGIDDGGRTFGDDPPGDDLVVRIPVPVKK